MRKADVIEHFGGTQQKTADALTALGFPITQRGVSAWPDPVPEKWAVTVERLTNGRLRFDLEQYKRHA
jgi:hypothetical protein